MTTSSGPSCRLTCVMRDSETAVMTRPAKMISRVSTRPISRPTMNMENRVPNPRGAVTRPVVTTG